MKTFMDFAERTSRIRKRCRLLIDTTCVDTERIGIWGSSYGGTLTIYSMLKNQIIKAGVAGAAADPFFFGTDDVAIVRRPQSHPEAFNRGKYNMQTISRSFAHHPWNARPCRSIQNNGCTTEELIRLEKILILFLF